MQNEWNFSQWFTEEEWKSSEIEIVFTDFQPKEWDIYLQGSRSDDAEFFRQTFLGRPQNRKNHFRAKAAASNSAGTLTCLPANQKWSFLN